MKPLITFGLSQALERIKQLEAEQKVFVSMALRTEGQLQQKDQELALLRQELQEALEREAEKETYIASLILQLKTSPKFS